MQIKTKLVLRGASAVIATALIFACRPVLIGALDAMRDLDLPVARAVFIAFWAFAVVATILWLVSNAVISLHSADESEPEEKVVQIDQHGKSRPSVNASAPASKDCAAKAPRPKVANGS